MAHQVLVEQNERNYVDYAIGDHRKHQPDDGFSEIARHLFQHRKVGGGSLERWGQFALGPRRRPPPSESNSGVEQFQPAGVVLPHPPEQLVKT